MSEQARPLSEIRNFTDFLEKCLERKVLDYTLKPLTKPGDNYGAVLQSVDVKVVGNKGRDEVSFEMNSLICLKIGYFNHFFEL